MNIVGHPNLLVKDFQLNNGWDVDFIRQLVGPDQIDEILEDLCKAKPGMDVLIWSKNDNGLFSTKSAWDCIRIRSDIIEGHSWIWHKSLPLKMSSLMWKAWYMAFSVDHHLRRIGIPITSRCDCCANGHFEDQNHVLFAGDIANYTWCYFGAYLGIPIGQNWKDTVKRWFRRANNSSQVGIILGILPVIITWRLWRRRCLARMEGRFEPVSEIIHSVSRWISLICRDMHASSHISSFDLQVLKSLNVQAVLIPIRRCKTFTWNRPSVGWVKLNTDGSSLGNPGASGIGSNNRAELLALLHGLQQEMWGVVSRGFLGGEIIDIIDSMTYSINHVFREGNKVADWLAKQGASGKDFAFSQLTETPRALRGLIRMDYSGLPSLRFS
ncbi:uncharacterized protein LOC118349411 [Juglans regia]|uniref:Uncharacterized protein LOC118349411 n=1 Tax=Juglans regia TaxID=51240 RepID=A0A6P9F4W6_JUGRE|nr:uncharacterized protein LOC118349411 [Juglans regia]